MFTIYIYIYIYIYICVYSLTIIVIVSTYVIHMFIYRAMLYSNIAEILSGGIIDTSLMLK